MGRRLRKGQSRNFHKILVFEPSLKQWSLFQLTWECVFSPSFPFCSLTSNLQYHSSLRNGLPNSRLSHYNPAFLLGCSSLYPNQIHYSLKKYVLQPPAARWVGTNSLTWSSTIIGPPYGVVVKISVIIYEKSMWKSSNILKIGFINIMIYPILGPVSVSWHHLWPWLMSSLFL